MQLSKRLSTVASMVTAGNRLADVGTDHGYVPIYLYERHLISSAIAMDINKGPLERAKLHIAEVGLEDMIITRLSDGMEALKPGEADSVIIAGMGGPLMLRILEKAPETTESLKELILQPQSEVAQVRKWLDGHGYEIIEEHMIYEEGKYYPMFKAVKNPERRHMSSQEYQFGRLEVLKEPAVLNAFLEKEILGKSAILEKLMQEPTEKSRDRAEQLKQLIGEYKGMLNLVLPYCV